MVVSGSLPGTFEIPEIIEYTLSKPIPQSFPFPSGIIHYLTHTPSSAKGYKKLLRTCKYFVYKKFIFITNNFYVKDESNDILLDYLIKIEALTDNLLYKLWLKRMLVMVNDNDSNVMTRMLRNVYRCDLIDITVSHQIFSYDEYLILVEGGAIKELSFYNVLVKYNDGKVVPLEGLMEMVPNVQQFKCSYTETSESAVTFKTAENLCNLPIFNKLIRFTIYDNYPRFNAIHFCDFIKKNGGNYSMIFRSTIIDEDWFKTFDKTFKDSDFIVEKKEYESMIPYSRTNNMYNITKIEIEKK